MARPLIPYVTVPELVLVPEHAFGTWLPRLSIKPFGVLVATGVYLGAYLAMRHGRKLRLNEAALASFIVWVVGAGFVGGHVLDTLFYYPGEVVKDPWSLLRLWEGLSSYGGFFGAALGAVFWKLRYKTRLLPYADVVAASLPTGFAFGRLGCSLVHDHPGARSQAWFAVRYPDGGRFDLGLYEFSFVVALAITFLILQRRPRPWGFYVGSMCLCYAPPRFALDFLRARDVFGADARYGGLTPAQWACLATVAAGLVIFLRAMSAETADAFVVPSAPSAFSVSPVTPES